MQPSQYFNATYANNRKQSGSGATTYDNAGNVIETHDSGPDNIYTKFDAAGRSWQWKESGTWAEQKGGESVFDGDSRPAKQSELTKTCTIPENCAPWNPTPMYHLYSSVTEQKIIDLDSDGEFNGFHVYMSGTEIVEGDNDEPTFRVVDPVTGGVWKTDHTGAKLLENNPGIHTELAGLQTSVPVIAPQPYAIPEYDTGGNPSNPENGCVDQYNSPMACSLRGVAERMGKKKATPVKEPIGIIVPDKMPKMPFADPDKGPSFALAVAFQGRADGGENSQQCEIGGQIGTIIGGICVLRGGDFEVQVRPGSDEPTVSDSDIGGLIGAEFGTPFSPPSPPPCPPSAQQIFSRFSTSFLNLLRTQSGHRTNKPLENGGWIYQKTTDGSLSFESVPLSARQAGKIDLSNPPAIRGARVVGNIHTHPYREQQQNNSLREQRAGFGLGTGPSAEDVRSANARGMPGLVIYEDLDRNHPANIKSDSIIGSKITAAWVGPDRLAQGGCN